MQAPLKAEEGKDGKESMVKEAGGDEDPPKKRRGIIISDKVTLGRCGIFIYS